MSYQDIKKYISLTESLDEGGLTDRDYPDTEQGVKEFMLDVSTLSEKNFEGAEYIPDPEVEGVWMIKLAKPVEGYHAIIVYLKDGDFEMARYNRADDIDESADLTEETGDTVTKTVVGHEDNEARMMQRELHKIENYASELRTMLDRIPNADYPHWWQAKLVKAGDYMSTIKHFLEAELENMEVEMAPVAYDPDMGFDLSYDDLMLPSVDVDDPEVF